MVNLTRIYTRTGDAGETRLGDMSVTTKNDLRLHAYATVDEANAHIGVALATGAVLALAASEDGFGLLTLNGGTVQIDPMRSLTLTNNVVVNDSASRRSV